MLASGIQHLLVIKTALIVDKNVFTKTNNSGIIISVRGNTSYINNY